MPRKSGGTGQVLLMNQDFIRNFAIIAHIDHGKSTLADRLLELTGTVAKRDMAEQLLDSNPIERERGITIKLAPVRMTYSSRLSYHVSPIASSGGDKRYEIRDTSKTPEQYVLNLIDTPGHVDFSYEVSRSLAACEGALLVVDATQGVQAQTLAHLHQARLRQGFGGQARLHHLVIIPIINKIDLPNARIEETEEELKGLGFTNEEIIRISAKTGENVEKVLEAIIERIPSPHGEPDKLLRALIFSSQYDTHKGVVVFVRVVDGLIGTVALRSRKNFDPSSVSPSADHNQSPHEKMNPDKIFSLPTQQDNISKIRLKFLASGAEVTPIEIGYFNPRMMPSNGLSTGEVGYIATGLKDVRFAKVGDTITESDTKYVIRDKQHQDHFPVSHITSHVSPLPGYKEPKPMVFLGLFPIDSAELTLAREAMERLRLSDSAFTFRPIASLALGNGFHCGFLGLLHAEIVQERLLREFGLTMIATAPSVEYRILLKHQGSSITRNMSHEFGILNHEENQEIQNSKFPGPTAGAGKIQDSHIMASLVAPENFVSIQSAAEFPDPSYIEEVKEPVMQVTIFAPKRFVGPIMQLAQEKRGAYVDLHYQADQAEFTYLIPLSEMIVDFFDRLKSATEGYASLDYEFYDYQTVQVVKLDVLVNKEKVDAFSTLAVEDQAQSRGRELVQRLASAIPRQQFEIPVQAAIGGQVIARADVKAFRKDVIQKLYGGDRTRKDKLLEKQKKGKAKMKRIGRVDIPQNAFFAVLKRV